MFKINGDINDVGDAISKQALIDAGYNTCHTGKSVTPEYVEDFIAAIQLDGFTVHDLRKFDDTVSAVSEDQEIYIIVDLDNNLTEIYTKGNKTDKVVAFYLEYKKYFEVKSDETVHIEYYSLQPMRGIDSSTIIVDKKNIQRTIPELYPDYDVEQLAKEYVASNDNILLLYGQPGVGKTHFVRYILSHGPFKDIIYIKDAKVLAEDDFWIQISQQNVDLMILDDMDAALKPRSKKGSVFMSNLLSFTDGIFEKKTKIIITTNQRIEAIDAAIVRPGRCFDFITLNALSYNQASQIWTETLNQPIEDFERLYVGQTEITQASLMSDYHRNQQRIMGRTYVKNGSQFYNVQTKLQANGVNIV